MISACGIHGLQPPTLSSLTNNGNAATQYGTSTTAAYAVSAYQLTEVTISWDVSQTGAQGVEVIIATDYDCQNVIISRKLPASCATSSNCIPLENYGVWNGNLEHVFYGQDISVLTAGQYYVCIAAITLNNISSPSLPAYLYLYYPQAGIAY